MFEIFFPQRIGDYYFLSQKILSIALDGYHIALTLAKISGNKRALLMSKDLMVARDESIAYELQMASALEGLIQGLSFDRVKIVLPAHQAIFKSLKLPFTDLEKLKMIVPFELAQSLPFSFQEASIDVIQARILPDTKESLVVAGIVRQETVALYREICKHAGIHLSILSIDAFEIASLYGMHHDTARLVSAIVHFDRECITVMLFEKEILVGIRVILRESVGSVPVQIADAQVTAKKQEKPEKDQQELAAAADVSLMGILGATMDTLKQQANLSGAIEQIWVTGIDESTLVSRAALIEKYLEIPASLLSCTALKEVAIEKIIAEDERVCSPAHIASFAGALMLHKMALFNLAQGESLEENRSLILKQVIAALCIFFLFIVSIGAWGYVRLMRVEQAEDALEKETIQFIKNNFELSGKNITTLDRAQKEAEGSVKQLEDMWLSVSGSSRFHVLRLLNSLSAHLEKDIKGMRIEEIMFKPGSAGRDDSLVLKGSVADFQSLRKLEDGLRNSLLFTSVPPAQDPHFSYNLVLKKYEEKS